MTRYRIFYPFARKYFGYGLCAAVFWLSAILASTGAMAQTENFGIAAVVNDTVVTYRDVENRARMLFLEGGLERTQENNERLQRLGRFQLLDEALQLQEVNARGIVADPRVANNFIRQLERNNNMPQGGLRDLLERNNIEYAHFEKQQLLRTAWSVLLQSRFDAAGGISDGEVEDYIERVHARQGEQEVRIREIFLPYPSPLLIGKTNALGQEVLERLASGADFATLARSFSASHSARQGGDTGWLPANFLAEHIKTAVASLQEGQVSELIETLSGVTIIKLEGRRFLGAEDIIAATDTTQVRNFLRNQKLELLHRQILHRIKSDAFIELR